METKIIKPGIDDELQLDRKHEIRDSWSSQVRERRRLVSKARQRWLVDLIGGTELSPASIA